MADYELPLHFDDSSSEDSGDDDDVFVFPGAEEYVTQETQQLPLPPLPATPDATSEPATPDPQSASLSLSVAGPPSCKAPSSTSVPIPLNGYDDHTDKTSATPPPRLQSQSPSAQPLPLSAVLEVLYAAASSGNLQLLQTIFQNASNTLNVEPFALANDASSRTGLTGLHAASSRGHIVIVIWRKTMLLYPFFT